jgi:CHAT domain-containing protein/Tol biopolymer transport system component
MKSTAKIFLLSVALFLSICSAQNEQPQSVKIIDYRQITTHPDVDLSPRISMDGQWMAYVSRTSGNFDIWIQNTSGGRARQLTTHKADDYYPAWDPKGKAIYFVSQRSDAAGDIWRQKLRNVEGQLLAKGEPERITDYLGFDGYPSISPDGKKVAFVSDRSGREEIWFYNYNTNLTAQLTFKGATHPAWSSIARFMAITTFREGDKNNGDIWIMDMKGYRILNLEDVRRMHDQEPMMWPVTHGPAMDGFPSWSPDAKRLVFLRDEYDTNMDGIISPADIGQLWAVDVLENPTDSTFALSTNPMSDYFSRYFKLNAIKWAMALTSGSKMAVQPWYGANNRIYFASDLGGNYDVWSLPADGHIPRLDTPEMQFNLANETYALPPRMLRINLGPLFLTWDPHSVQEDERMLLLDRVIAFQRVIDFHGADCDYAAASLYEIAVCKKLLGFDQEAQFFLNLIISQYPQNRLHVAYAKMALIDYEVAKTLSLAQRADELRSRLAKITSEYKDQPSAAAAGQIAIGDLYFEIGKSMLAFSEYSKVQRDFPDQKSECAESQLKIGDVYKNFASQNEVVQAYLEVVKRYPEERQWMIPARDRILDLLSTGLKSGKEFLARFREIVGQYADFGLLSAAAQLRIGNILYSGEDYNSALQEYEVIESLFPTLTDEVFTSQMAQSHCYLKMNESLRAFALLEKMSKEYAGKRPDLESESEEALLDALLKSGDELKALHDYELALARYRRAKTMDSKNIHAHRGYLECMYYLKRIDQAIPEYEQINKVIPNNNILIYALGLAYSYKGTERSEFENHPEQLDPEYLSRSSATIARALSYDFTMVQAYLTLAYNYEMMETYLARVNAKPKKFYVQAFEAIAAPVITLYHTLTFYEERKPARYYERAIHELTKALALNDETLNPELEASLSLNLANNYYNLQEFGYQKAYEYYHMKLKYDSTFTDKARRALIYERMGHCALTTEDLERGPKYLLIAINYYKEKGEFNRVLLNLQRLALLYQIGDRNDMAIEYYQQAAEVEKRNQYFDGLMRDYRNIAYNYLLLGESRDAIQYAQKSLELIDTGKVKKIKKKASRIKVGILGLFFPIPFVDLSDMGTISSAQFTTKDEKAVLYTILGSGFEDEKDYTNAIEYLQKKKELYFNSKDATAVAAFLNNIGYLYYLKGDYQSSWNSFKESIVLCEKDNIEYGILTNTLNMARLFLSCRDFDFKTDKRQLSMIDYQNEHEFVVKKINSALILSGKNKVRFSRVMCQLNYLLGKLSLIQFDENLTTVSFEKKIEQSFGLIDRASYAVTYFNEGLTIAQQFKLTREECYVHNALGELLFLLYDTQKSFEQLRQARRLALRFGYFDILWRIGVNLGDLVASMDLSSKRSLAIQTDAYEYYDEAIQIIQKHPIEATGMIARSNRILSQVPYRHALSYLIKKGDTIGALELAEQMRAKEYFDIMSNEDLVLNKERHKIYYGNAKYLQSEINKLDIELIVARNQTDVATSKIAEARKQRLEYEKEYQDIIAKVRAEVPALENLICVKTVPYRDVQSRLRNGEVVLYFLSFDDHFLLWNISGTDISVSRIEVSPTQLQNEVNDWLEGRRQDLEALSTFFSFLKESNSSLKSLIIVPDPSLLLYPWAAIIQKLDLFKETLPSVVVSSSMASYYFSFDNRKIPGKNFYYANNTIAPSHIGHDGFQINVPVETKLANSFSSQVRGIELADFIFMHVQSEWNDIDPNRSRFGYRVRMSAPAIFTPLSIYELSLNANLVQFNFDENIMTSLYSESFLGVERAVMYAGSPSLLISLWPSSAAGDTLFDSVFYHNIRSMSAAHALAETQKYFIQMGKPVRDWAGFQLYGFGGMSYEESEHYASEGFEAKVRRGHSAFGLGEWSDALRYYSEALLMAQKQNDVKTTALLRQRIMESAVNGGLWDSAIEIQKQIISQAEKENDMPGIASGYNNLAFFYTQNKQFELGVHYKEEYTRLAEKYGLKEEEAKSLRETGLIFERGGNYSSAIEFYKQAEQNYRDLKMTAQQAQCLSDIGRIYFFYLDHYSEALDFQQQAISLLQPQGASTDLVTTLNNVGLTFEKIANYRDALEFHQKALNYATMLNNVILTAQTKQYIANIYWKTGDYQQALKLQDEVMKIFTQEDAAEFLQVAYSTRGLINFSLGQTVQALKDETDALNLAKEKENLINQATILKNIGMIERTEGENQQALSNFKAAMAIDSTISSRRGLAYDFRNISSLYIEMDSLKIARKNIEKALLFSKEIGDWRNIVQSLLVTGRLEMKEQARDSARVHFMRAAELAEQFFMPEIGWRAYKELATINRLEGDLTLAVENYYHAARIIEEMRAKIKVEEYASGFVDDKLSVYGELISVLVDTGQEPKAFDVAERAKSRNFLDMLGNRKIDFQNSDAELTNQLDSLKNQISQKQADLFYIRGFQNTIQEKTGQMKKLEQDISQLQEKYLFLLIETRQKNPELSEMISVEPWPVKKIQSFLPNDTAIIEYYIYNDSIFIWFVTADRVAMHKVLMKEKELEQDVTALRTGLNRHLSIVQWSKKLFEKLIQPVEQDLIGIKHIIFVPHTILHYLPFALLQDASNNYLGLNYTLSLSPSATVLGFCMEKGETYLNQDRRAFPVLAFGNPTIDNTELALPFAEKEVRSLGRFYHHVDSYIEKRATEKQFREYKDYPPLILFSCHGVFNESNPLLSALLLAPYDGYDGRLEANEIFGLNLKTFLIAMSACETGLGTVRGGDEVIGLSRSFIYSGAASLMASLWKVDDLATAVLVKRFFRYLAEGQSRAQALQNAQKIVYQEIDPYPAFWAAFYIIGDFR